jgi:hypothetical protein
VVKSTLDQLVNASYRAEFGAAVGCLIGEIRQLRLAK